MQVVYSINARLGSGGLGRTSFQTVRAIYRKGDLKRVVAFGNRQKKIPAHYIRSINVHPVKLLSNLPARYYYPAKRRALDHAARRELRSGGDIFHGWTGCSRDALRYCRKNGIISFLEVPGPHRVYFNRLLQEEYVELGIRRDTSANVLERLLAQGEEYYQEEYELASYILLQSEFTRDTFLEFGFPPDKLVVVPNGVDVSDYSPCQQSSDDTFRLVYIGQVCARKGVRYLLDAWEHLPLADAELVLVGHVNDEVRSTLKAALDRSNNIRVLGQVDDVLGVLRSSSALVLPSLIEGSAKVTYEAMACGLPVVVTANSGAVARNGEHGCVVPARDAGALATAIRSLYDHPEKRRDFGRNARNYVKQFTWDRRAAHMIALYENAFADRDRT